MSGFLFYLAELGGALLGGFILSLLAYYLIGLALFSTAWGNQLGMGVLTLQIYGSILGFGSGAAVGTALVGRLLSQPGSFWFALLGAILGGALVALIMRLLALGGLVPTAMLSLLVAAIGAVGGYNLRR